MGMAAQFQAKPGARWPLVFLRSCRLAGALVCLAWVSSALAESITQWTFNDTNAPVASPLPALGQGTASLLAGVVSVYVGGASADHGGTNKAWSIKSFPGTFVGNKTAGVQFDVSTVGYHNIAVSWYQENTSTASRYARFQYSVDGTHFTDGDVIAITKESSFTNIVVDLASIPAATNNPLFAFRIVAEFEKSATGSGSDGYVATKDGSDYNASSGALHFDLVTVSGVPYPPSNYPPSISSVADQTLRVGQATSALPFSVLDAEDPASNLVVTARSSDAAVVPGNNIMLGGSGPSRTVTVTAGNQPGSATVTLTVTDLGGAFSSSSFLVTVLPANTAPSISAIAGTNTLVNVTAPPVGFTVSDLETPAAGLTLSAVSANPVLVPNNPANIAFGGSASNRTVTLTPAANQIGVAPVTVTVSDGTNTASARFALMVAPSRDVLCYEPFAYPDGSILTNSGFLWNHRSGSKIGECLVTNGQLQITASQSEDVSVPLIGAPYAKSSNTVLYAAFKVRFLNLPKDSPDYFAHFGSGSTYRGRIYAATPTNAPPGSLRLYVSNASDTNAVAAGDLATNATATLVLRYNIDTATASLWLNPTFETDPATTAVDSQTPVAISSFNFRQDSGYDSDMLIDDLKVGLSFAAVTATNPAPAAAIPLQIERVGANVILRWTNSGFALQASTAVGGPYTDVSGAISPVTNAIIGAAKFFRLNTR